MGVTKRVVQVAGLAAGVVGTVAVAAPDTRVGRSVRAAARRIARDVGYIGSSAPGLAYRLAGRRPDPDVADDVLADRIRSTIGPLELRLDVPRVHVMVEDHVAILHGEVPAETDADAIENAVMNVSGVAGVESHLHAGLIDGDTRPSRGAAESYRPSPALQSLMDAARQAGAVRPVFAVHAVLCTFLERIPAGERAHVFAHLPADVRSLAGPPRHQGNRARVKTLEELVAAASAEGGVDVTHAAEITRAIVTTLRELVPDEARDVAAVLPLELRQLWGAAPAR